MLNGIGSSEDKILLMRFSCRVGATHSRRGLILSCKLFVDPEEFVAFVQHFDETAKTVVWVFGFEQGMEFAQGCVLGAEGCAML